MKAKGTLALAAAIILMTGCQVRKASQTQEQPEPQTERCATTGCELGKCDESTGKCVVECQNSSECSTSEKPVCSKGLCIPCSAEYACFTGICDVSSGRCIECMTDNDCKTRERGLCIANVCTTCSTSNCKLACNEITGKCEQPVELPCPGGVCGTPAPKIPIDPVIIGIPRPPIVIIRPPKLEQNETEPEISSYNVDAKVAGMFATVTTEFTITNNNHRVLEGNLEFPLPDDAVVSGYAIDVNGVMVEASVVEKQKARIAFEKEVKKGVDPGLVEQVKGNAYRTRIYPIPANGSRRVRVEYTTPLVIASNGDAALSLPMPKKRLNERNVTIRVAADMPTPVLGGLGDQRFVAAAAEWHVDSHETNVTPTEDVLVAMPKLPDVITSFQHNNGDIFFAASVKMEAVEAQAIAMPNSWRIVWDASGSRKPADIEQAKKLLNQLPEIASYQLHVFRNEVDPVKTFNSRAELLAAIDAMPYDGSTDFSKLEALAKQGFAGQTLFFTDGIDTVTGALPEFGANSIAVVSGDTRDMSSMRQICGGRAFNMTIMTGEEAISQLLKSVPVVSGLNGANISNIQGIGLPASGRVTVLGRLNGEGRNAELQLSDGRRIPIDLSYNTSTVASGKTLAAAWAARRVDELSPRADDHREELLAIGRRFKIVSPVTSMIVMETLSQYLEHDIEPPESLTTMHAEWLRRRPSEASIQQEKELEALDWKDKITRIWNNRVEWWNNPTKNHPAYNDEVEDEEFEPADEEAEDEESAVFDSAPVPAMAMEAGNAPRRIPMILRTSEMNESSSRRPSMANAASNNSASPSVNAKVTVKAWDPNTPYIQRIKDAQLAFNSIESGYSEYLRQREQYASSPAFFFDCANYFYNQQAPVLASRILSNLSELSIDDVAMLRVYAWRLREHGDYKNAIIILEKVAKLRPDEALTWRDLALAYTMLGKQTKDAAAVEKALNYYYKAAFTPCGRVDATATAIVAIEEFNELAAWSRRQTWQNKAPVIPQIEAVFNKNLDTDLRIAMMWDADSTDIDLHVVEPSGEEIFFGHRFSRTGGMVSHDIVSGYGPEEAFYKTAPKGTYTVKTNYFSSHQQTLVGPATVTVMYYTNWGRENQESHITSLRLDKERDKITIGSIEVK